MVILPIEKRFDWAHAPLVLAGLVLLNVVFFLLYQSSDNEKIFSALESYSSGAYFEKEWPLYQAFLEENNEQEQLSYAKELYETEQIDALIVEILLDEDFYHYLKENGRALFYAEFYLGWSIEREILHQKVMSISSLAHGLRPDRLSVFDLISHQFMHGGVMHLLGNMLFLIVTGFAVEAALGHQRFLAFYLLAGVGGGLAHALLNLESSIPLIGASGAISGVMAMYLAIFRLKKIEFFYWIFVFVGYFRAPALLVLPLYIGMEIYNYFSEPDIGIAYWAHIGGFVIGALLIGLMLKIKPELLNEEYVEEEQDLNPRQQALAEIYEAIEGFHFNQAYKALASTIKTYGLDFELAYLRVTLLKIQGGERFQSALQALVSLKHFKAPELNKLADLWNEYPENFALLDNPTALSAGLSFCDLDDPGPAERIFQNLHREQFNHASMPVFAGRLAQSFERTGNMKKHKLYEQAAAQYNSNLQR